MFGWFKKRVEKEEFDELKQGVQTAFEKIKQDVGNTSAWIKHLDERENGRDDTISDIYEELSTVRSELENVNNIIDIPPFYSCFLMNFIYRCRAQIQNGIINLYLPFR